MFLQALNFFTFLKVFFSAGIHALLKNNLKKENHIIGQIYEIWTNFFLIINEAWIPELMN